MYSFTNVLISEHSFGNGKIENQTINNYLNYTMKQRILCLLFLFQIISFCANASDGYDLWMGYHKINKPDLAMQYKAFTKQVYIQSTLTETVIKNEISIAVKSMLEQVPSYTKDSNQAGLIFKIDPSYKDINEEGYAIHSVQKHNKNSVVIIAKQANGLLYGCYALLRSMQMQVNLTAMHISSSPTLPIRILNHWDNINRSVERGYAGISIFNWHTLPDYIDKRYIDYARANASIGINGTVVTNVNANAQFLTKEYLVKVKALADAFRPYGIKIYLTARFSAPIEIGNLKTADPLDSTVRNWWATKAKEIYSLIPDFGGFLVKANSEGQPGPQNYNRTHADGANMIAKAVAPFKGIVIWRAFVYSNETPEDRFKQAYTEFKPLDGKFDKNVLVQIKNGPIDFQPREPFHPLFGAMPKTPEVLEFQITQEYLGQATHLVYEGPMFKEVLESKINATQTVMDVLENPVSGLSGMSGVANIGNDINWCGHPFAQANWYAFGRLAWNPHTSAKEIANEWIQQTFSNDKKVVDTINNIMLSSYENMVHYMTPLGLHHIMGNGHHYGPMPWGNTLSRADWNPVYYHKSDAYGTGFDRVATGSNAIAQYDPNVQQQWKDSSTCDERFLLWFHHVSWNHTMKNGNSFWNELCYQYNDGVNGVSKMQNQWKGLAKYINEDQHKQVSQLLAIQLKDAIWWRDACLLYFQTFSKQPLPKDYPLPAHDLKYYQSLNFPFAPGNGK